MCFLLVKSNFISLSFPLNKKKKSMMFYSVLACNTLKEDKFLIRLRNDVESRLLRKKKYKFLWSIRERALFFKRRKFIWKLKDYKLIHKIIRIRKLNKYIKSYYNLYSSILPNLSKHQLVLDFDQKIRVLRKLKVQLQRHDSQFSLFQSKNKAIGSSSIKHILVVIYKLFLCCISNSMLFQYACKNSFFYQTGFILKRYNKLHFIPFFLQKKTNLLLRNSVSNHLIKKKLHRLRSSVSHINILYNFISLARRDQHAYCSVFSFLKRKVLVVLRAQEQYFLLKQYVILRYFIMFLQKKIIIRFLRILQKKTNLVERSFYTRKKIISPLRSGVFTQIFTPLYKSSSNNLDLFSLLSYLKSDEFCLRSNKLISDVLLRKKNPALFLCKYKQLSYAMRRKLYLQYKKVILSKKKYKILARSVYKKKNPSGFTTKYLKALGSELSNIAILRYKTDIVHHLHLLIRQSKQSNQLFIASSDSVRPSDNLNLSSFNRRLYVPSVSVSSSSLSHKNYVMREQSLFLLNQKRLLANVNSSLHSFYFLFLVYKVYLVYLQLGHLFDTSKIRRDIFSVIKKNVVYSPIFFQKRYFTTSLSSMSSMLTSSINKQSSHVFSKKSKRSKKHTTIDSLFELLTHFQKKKKSSSKTFVNLFPRRRRVIKQNSDTYTLFIKSTYSNCFVSLFTSNGELRKLLTCGKIGYLKAKRSSYYAAVQAGTSMGQFLKQLKLKRGSLHVVVKGFGFGKKAVLKGLKKIEKRFFYNVVSSYTSYVSHPHNGCRPRKKKRR